MTGFTPDRLAEITGALLDFVAGGVAIVAIVRGPFRITAPTLGVSSLLTLLPYFLGDASPMLAFGEGGLERRVAYPVLLSGPGFGGYLVGGARAVGADPRRLTARS